MTRHIAASKRAAAAALVIAALALAAGCKKNAAEKAAAPPPAKQESSLSARLDAMKPLAQVDTMRTLVQADTSDAQLRFLQGNAYYSFATGLDESSSVQRSAYFDSATVSYQHAVANDSTMSKAWVNMGLVYSDWGKRVEARKALEKAIDVNPKDVLAYCHLGYLDHLSGNLSDAMLMYRQALAIDPNSAQAHYNLGLAFAEQKIFNEAVREWQLVIKNDPNSDLGKTAAENVKIIQQYNSR